MSRAVRTLTFRFDPEDGHAVAERPVRVADDLDGCRHDREAELDVERAVRPSVLNTETSVRRAIKLKKEADNKHSPPSPTHPGLPSWCD